MELYDRRLLDLMGAALREGAETVGTPCRAAFLFSNRAVATIDVAKDCMCNVVSEVAGECASRLPFVVSVLGPFGVWIKTTQEATNRLQ
jgi:hypothetical protein